MVTDPPLLTPLEILLYLLETFWDVWGHFGRFWDVVGCYETIGDNFWIILGHFEAVWDILDHFGTFWDMLVR